MYELIGFFEGILKASKLKQKNLAPDDFYKWKQCVALSKIGWKIINCVKKENSDNIIITWQKEDRKNIEIELSFVEQCIWLDYLNKRKTENECEQ